MPKKTSTSDVVCVARRPPPRSDEPIRSSRPRAHGRRREQEHARVVGDDVRRLAAGLVDVVGSRGRLDVLAHEVDPRAASSSPSSALRPLHGCILQVLPSARETRSESCSRRRAACS